MTDSEEETKRLQIAWVLAIKLLVRQVSELLHAAGVDSTLALDSAALFTPRREPVRTVEFVVSDPEAALTAFARAGWESIGARAVVRNGIQVMLGESPRMNGPEFLPFFQELNGGLRTRKVVIGGLDFTIPADVFEPNAEVTGITACALDFLRTVSNPCVVDVGTGSGAIALAIAHERRDARVMGTDVSPTALHSATQNAAALGIANVLFLRGSLLEPVALPERGRIDAVLANLPFVSPLGVALHELADGRWRGPMKSVMGDDADGLGLLRRLACEARGVLRPGGLLLLVAQNNQVEQLRMDLIDDYAVEPADTTPWFRGYLRASAAQPCP